MAAGTATLTAFVGWQQAYSYDGMNCYESGTSAEEATGDMAVASSVGGIQYQSGSNYVDISGTLYVLKGTSVTFKAVPNPSNATFASGQPVWSGSSEASGTGQTTSVTFNTTSSSMSDFKTVTTTAGNSVTVNVVVFELTGVFTPQDNFQGRSQTRYGLVEKVDLSFTATPSVSASQAGGLRWKITAGQGTLNNTDNGVDTYTAPKTSQDVTIKLEVENGPSKGLGPSYNRTIVAPSGAAMKQQSGNSTIIHCFGFSSVGFYGEVYLLPKDVSFANLTFREGGGTLSASGLYSSANNTQHNPTGFMSQVGNCNIIDGCKTFVDTVYTGAWPNPNGGSTWPAGTANWPIDWLYAFNFDIDPAFNGQTKFTTAVHHQESDTAGRATINKASSPSFSKNANDPDSSCQ